MLMLFMEHVGFGTQRREKRFLMKLMIAFPSVFLDLESYQPAC